MLNSAWGSVPHNFLISHAERGFKDSGLRTGDIRSRCSRRNCLVAGTLCVARGFRHGASRSAARRAHLRRALKSVYEFFGGVGGMRLAYQEAVGKSELPSWRCFEVDETCCKAYCELYGSKYVTGVQRGELWRSSARARDELWRCSIDRLPDAAFEGGDLWLMSPPCQPFTRSGKRRDLADPRCRALIRLLEALPALAEPPKALLLENVPEFQHSRAYDRLISSLRKLGYATEDHMLSPVDFGFPNTRTRFYVIAVAGNEAAELPELQSDAALRPVGSFLCAEVEEEALQVPKQLLEQAYAKNYTLDLADNTSLATKTFTAAYGKPDYGGTGLSVTGPLLMQASAAQPRFQHLEPSQWQQVRYFSPKEVAGLMGFPAGWQLPGELPLRTQWRLLGNSINVTVVSHLVSRLLQWQAIGSKEAVDKSRPLR
ncbi:unnamed protein product [Effrenium voratum]|nr:unnamed protein product [Effrenium voratum]